jgi:hypothetical protein
LDHSRGQLTVTLAPGFRAEQEYILDVLLREFLGLAFQAVDPPAGQPVVTISLGGKTIRLRQVLFGGDGDCALPHAGRPPSCLRLRASDDGLRGAALQDDEVPILFGEPDRSGHWITADENGLVIHADVLGSSFFALTRLEELEAGELDEHGRFPDNRTIAYAEGFLTRPIVDEYVEILWECFSQVWPGLQRKARAFSVCVSHDVDRPMAYDHASVRDRLWSVGQDARDGKLPRLLGSRALNGLAAVLRLPHQDPFANFDWLMQLDEARGLRATYYFLAGGQTRYDGRYSIRSKAVRRLLRQITERGHQIGLHGSYATLDDPRQLSRERDQLATVLHEEGLPSEVTSLRQHYLRWRASDTWQAAEAAGLSVDASVGFTDTIGFRAGTSHEYPVFDVLRRRSMRLRERPLHVMDRALGSLGQDAALEAIAMIRQSVARHGGTLEALWHNNVFLENPLELVRYQRAIAPVGQP